MPDTSPAPSRVNLADAKARLSELLDAALRGEPIVICRHGVPLVRLVPVDDLAPRPFGIASDWIIDDAALLAPMDEADLAAAEGDGTDAFGLSQR